MRNVAFSIMLGALALLQVAVVAAELSHSHVKTAAVASGEADARQVLVSAETGSKVSTKL